MPYVQRSDDGSIVSLTQVSDKEHSEFLAPTHIDIIEFLMGSSEVESAKETLLESDQDFARATEDLIHLLVQKNIILFTDLPDAVQAKMVGREKMRVNLNSDHNPDNFLDDSELI